MGRYDPPDPLCHHKRAGVVTAGDPTRGPHAATNCCDRQACIDDALAWARAVTGLTATWVRDEDRATA